MGFQKIEDVMKFNNAQGNELRVVEFDGGIWFVACDILRGLGFFGSSTIPMQHVINIDKQQVAIGNVSNIFVVKWSGVEKLMSFYHTRKTAQFENWVRNDVITKLILRPATPAAKEDTKAISDSTDISRLEHKIDELQQLVKTMLEEAREPGFPLGFGTSLPAEPILDDHPDPDIVAIEDRQPEPPKEEPAAPCTSYLDPGPRWRAWSNGMIDKLVAMAISRGSKIGAPYFWNLIYDEIDKKFGINLHTMRDDLKAEVQKENHRSRSKPVKVSILDVIEQDGRYIKALKEAVRRIADNANIDLIVRDKKGRQIEMMKISKVSDAA